MSKAMKEIDTAFGYIPDESNDSVIYIKETTSISIGINFISVRDALKNAKCNCEICSVQY